MVAVLVMVAVRRSVVRTLSVDVTKPVTVAVTMLVAVFVTLKVAIAVTVDVEIIVVVVKVVLFTVVVTSVDALVATNVAVVNVEIDVGVMVLIFRLERCDIYCKTQTYDVIVATPNAVTVAVTLCVETFPVV